MHEPEVLAVLFTDLVGSTALLSALGDDEADAQRRRHFALLRHAIAVHGGREVKALGDGLMVAFSSARQAVACAAAMQESVSADPERLGLRVGIDAGEPIREDDDLYGMPVVVARRLCDAATGGQVLVSDVVRMLSGRRLDVPLEALGPLELKGLDEPIVAHAVRWPTAGTPIGKRGAAEQDGARRHDPFPAPAGVVTPLPGPLARAAARPFVARAHELERLRQAWAAARAGETRTALVAGEPGIGKTSLAARLAHEAHVEGGRVVLGRCLPEALVPYEPFVEALRQLPEAMLRRHAAALGHLLPELAPEPAAPPADFDERSARYLLFDAVARVLGAAARQRALVLVLEDLHWAEPPTLLLLRHLMHADERAPLLVVATYRTTEVGGSEQVVSSVASLARDLAVERMPLNGLVDEEVAELIRAVEGRPSSPSLGHTLRRDTAGNPLFVSQLLRHLAETGVLVERDGELSLSIHERIGVPESVRELVAARLSGLASETVSALRGAAVIGRAFGSALVASVEERRVVAVLDSLEAGVASGLVEELGDGRHAFVHALVREAIYDGTPAGRRAALHAAVAAALEAHGGADPAELAHHFLAAGDRVKGVDYSLVSGDRALARLAYEDAAGHYGHALTALGGDDPDRRCELLLALGDAHARAGDTAACRVAYHEAAELAEELSLPGELARAAIGYGGRVIWEVSRDDPEVQRLLERALARIGEEDSPLRVRLLTRLGGGPLRDNHDPTRRRAITQEALEVARRLEDPDTLAYALDGYIAAHHSPDHTPGQVELAGELVDIAVAAGDLERAIEAYEHRATARLELGDTAGAAADVEAMAPLAAELRQPSQHWFVAERRAVHALHEGRLAEAEALIAEALHIGSEALEWNARIAHLLELIALRGLQGRVAELEPAARAAAADWAASYPVCRCAYAHVLAAAGHEDEARGVVADLARDNFGALDFDETWLGAAAFLAEAVYTLGDRESAEALYGRLAPYADRVAASTGEVALGSVPRYLGLLAAAAGRTDAAVEHFEAAVAFDTRIGARGFAALTLADHAELTRDPALAARAREACAALGMDAIAERSAALLG